MSKIGFRLFVFLLLVGVVGVLIVDGGYFPIGGPAHLRYAVRGVDVSRHQDTINWEAVGRNEVDFAFIKATEGIDWIDPRFEENWEGASNAGIERGAYHFFRFCRTGEEQAQHFLNTVPPQANTLPPAVDVEYTGNCGRRNSADHIRTELKAFIETISEAHGRAPFIYADSDAYRRIIAGHFEDVPLWIPTLGEEPDPPDGRDWTFWQYDHQGSVDGIDGHADLNVFAGSRWAFERFVD